MHGEKLAGSNPHPACSWRLTRIKLLTNCMNIRSAESETSLGCSLDLAVAMMNHSCSPNAVVFFEGGQVRVRSLGKIAEGGEIFVSYVDPRMDVLRRREALRKTHFIECHCKVQAYCTGGGV